MDQGEASGSGSGAMDLGSGKKLKYKTLVQDGPPCAPLQQTLEDYPVASFDIGGVEPDDRIKRLLQFKEIAFMTIHRMRKIGPGMYYGRPITPQQNPSNPKCPPEPKDEKCKDDRDNKCKQTEDPASGYSYHIIQLTHTGKTSKRVQLLIRDFDLYLVAFRRYKDNQWSKWYHYKDSPIPNHLDGIALQVRMAHDKQTTIGSTGWLEGMFYGMANYPEKAGCTDEVEMALLRAVILFCEGIRLRPVYRLLVRALQYEMEPFQLEASVWNSINNWGHLCEFALAVGMKGGQMDEEKFHRLVRRHVDDFMSLVVNSNALLMALMRNDEVLLPKAMADEMKEKLKETRNGKDVREPGFVKPEEDMWGQPEHDNS